MYAVVTVIQLMYTSQIQDTRSM